MKSEASFTVDVIIVAAGRGTRAKTHGPKQWCALHGRRVVDWSIAAFAQRGDIRNICLVVHSEDQHLAPEGPICVVGGASRQASVNAGLNALAQQDSPPHAVLIQDAARPCVSQRIITDVIDTLKNHQGAAPAVAVTDTIWQTTQSNPPVIAKVIPRQELFGAQTPQGFLFDLIYQAHQNFVDHDVTDDVSLGLLAKLDVRLVKGDPDNIKITHPEDFQRAEEVLHKHGF